VRPPQLPAGLRWDHNAHYHRWLLRQLPARPVRVLDVGCGSGALACVLAGRAMQVDAVDLSPLMIESAASRCRSRTNVRWLVGDLLDPALPLAPEGYDAVTAVASLHHLPLRPALLRLAGIVRPSGVLAVVGLSRPATIVDHSFAALGMPANAAMGVALALRGRAGESDADEMPVREPQSTLAEVSAATRELLPGADLRRGLFWRYLLRWCRPPADG
jgi:SAM-dependent methyltransferase